MEVEEIIEALSDAEELLPKPNMDTAMTRYLRDLPGSIPAPAVFEGKAYNAEREQVRFGRMNGQSCEEIAMQLSMPEVLVKFYCTELGLPVEGNCRMVELSAEEAMWFQEGMKGIPLSRMCPQCGREVIQPRTGRKKRFCSDVCRYHWRDAHLDRKKCARSRIAVCENCGRTFVAVKEYGSKRRFCCCECYYESRFGKAVSENEEETDHWCVSDLQYGGDLCT